MVEESLKVGRRCCQWDGEDGELDCAHKAPSWITRDNKFLLRGYRKTGRPMLEVLGTAFSLHNETFNIWSHAIPSAWFLAQTLRVVSDDQIGFMQKIPAMVSGAGGYLFGVSAFAHLVCAHGERTNAVCFACDKASIPIFLWSCSMGSSMLYLREERFKSFSLLRKFAVVLNTASCVCASYTIGMSSLGWEMNNEVKVKILASQVVGGLLPAILEMVKTTDPPVRNLILRYAILSCGWASVGAAFFVAFFPEKYFPGILDKLVYSHGAMHICVALSVLNAFRGYTKVFRRVYPRP